MTQLANTGVHKVQVHVDLLKEGSTPLKQHRVSCWLAHRVVLYQPSYRGSSTSCTLILVVYIESCIP